MKHAVGLAFVSIVVAFAFLAGRWIQEHYVSRPEIEPATGPFHNPGYRRRAENAVRRFSILPAAEQAALRSNLEENIVSFTSWLDRMDKSQIKVLCLGEDHEDATRQFLARGLFSELDVDVLLLEATPHQLGLITQELRWGRERVSLLGADIAGIIRAARSRNPDLELIGIEETKAQRIARHNYDKRGTRDESIQNNFWKAFRYGSRYAILIGALHCTSRDEWLYGSTRRLAPRRVAREMLNVRVMGEHQDGSIEALVYFLEKIGIQRDDFVVVDSKAVDPVMHEWFELLGVLFENFTALIVFRNQA